MNNKLEVSIICNTYNQEQYIRSALDGFVMQKTAFLFEVLIHDDASTDKTAEIIREYTDQYPNMFKPIYETENQYSQGVDILADLQCSRAAGRYIALCEGDDYWIDPCKLQKQYDAMERHPEIDMCAHSAQLIRASTGKAVGKLKTENNDCVLGVEDVIRGGGGYIATASLFYRVEIQNNELQFHRFLPLDYAIQINGALRGGILYLKDCMCAYRVLAEGSWTQNMQQNAKKHTELLNKIAKTLEILDTETNHKYSAAIQHVIKDNEIQILEVNGQYKKIMQNPYKSYYKRMPPKRKILIFLKGYFPFLITIKRKYKYAKK